MEVHNQEENSRAVGPGDSGGSLDPPGASCSRPPPAVGSPFPVSAVCKGLAMETTRVTLIDALPQELLGFIFAFASASTLCTFKRDRKDSLLAVSGVCQRWRQLALDTKSLWSHIDINITASTVTEGTRELGLSDTTLLRLERAKGAPLHLHFSRRVDTLTKMLPELVDHLQRLAINISSVRFSVACPEELIRGILVFCSQHTLAGGLRTLAIYGRNITWNMWEPLESSPALLRALTTLKIGPIVNSVYGTTERLAHILANCPSLKTLWLEDNMIYYRENQTVPSITLACLQTLSLTFVESRPLHRLLEKLTVGENDLYVRLEFYSVPETLAAIGAFFDRSRVVSLYVGWGASEVIQASSSLLHLHTLYLDLSSECEARLRLLTSSTREGRRMPKCPTVQHLYLVNGRFAKAELRQIKRIVQTYSLTELSFIHCSLWMRSKFLAWRSPDDTHGNFLKNWLTERVERVAVLHPTLYGTSWHRTRWDPVIDIENLYVVGEMVTLDA